MNTKKLNLFNLFIVLFFLSFACHGGEPATKSSYPVVDSGVWADWHGYIQSIYWVDNDRVIFQTVKDNDKTRVSRGPFFLAIWELGKKVKPYTETANFVGVCVQEGIIFYALAADKKHSKRFYGRFGEEKPYEFPRTKGVFFDESNCRPIDNQEILAKRQAGRAIKPLLDRHGYLDVGPIHEKPGVKEPATFYPSSQSKGIELPILGRDASIIRYYPFKGAYLIHGLNYGGGIKSKKFWWLYPDGKVEEHSIPVETNPYPTRKGIVTTRGAPKLNRDSSAAGLYLWGGKEPVELLAGYAEGVQISPDGCKLAFSHHFYSDATLIKDPGRITLKLINLCVEEKTHDK